jgi:3-isopropylmalate/(R)-2-methylmalate dehydratase small subunit
MDPVKTFHGLVAPLDRANVDTDAIIPKQFMKSVKRTGFGKNLFDEWRYLDRGEPDAERMDRELNMDFILNQGLYRSANVLLARGNFGCGSSREHAVWALQEFGFRAIIAPSFSDIFYENCVKNGLLPVALEEEAVDAMMVCALSPDYCYASVNLERQTVTAGDVTYFFEIDQFKKNVFCRAPTI